jgi:hypothetical protein
MRIEGHRHEVAQVHAMEIKNLKDDHDASAWMLEAQETSPLPGGSPARFGRYFVVIGNWSRLLVEYWV